MKLAWPPKLGEQAVAFPIIHHSASLEVTTKKHLGVGSWPYLYLTCTWPGIPRSQVSLLLCNNTAPFIDFSETLARKDLLRVDGQRLYPTARGMELFQRAIKGDARFDVRIHHDVPLEWDECGMTGEIVAGLGKHEKAMKTIKGKAIEAVAGTNAVTIDPLHAAGEPSLARFTAILNKVGTSMTDGGGEDASLEVLSCDAYGYSVEHVESMVSWSFDPTSGSIVMSASSVTALGLPRIEVERLLTDMLHRRLLSPGLQAEIENEGIKGKDMTLKELRQLCRPAVLLPGAFSRSIHDAGIESKVAIDTGNLSDTGVAGVASPGFHILHVTKDGAPSVEVKGDHVHVTCRAKRSSLPRLFLAGEACFLPVRLVDIARDAPISVFVGCTARGEPFVNQAREAARIHFRRAIEDGFRTRFASWLSAERGPRNKETSRRALDEQRAIVAASTALRESMEAISSAVPRAWPSTIRGLLRACRSDPGLLGMISFPDWEMAWSSSPSRPGDKSRLLRRALHAVFDVVGAAGFKPWLQRSPMAAAEVLYSYIPSKLLFGPDPSSQLDMIHDLLVAACRPSHTLPTPPSVVVSIVAEIAAEAAAAASDSRHVNALSRAARQIQELAARLPWMGVVYTEFAVTCHAVLSLADEPGEETADLALVHLDIVSGILSRPVPGIHIPVPAVASQPLEDILARAGNLPTCLHETRNLIRAIENRAMKGERIVA